MFRNRNDHLDDLIDLHKCLASSNTSDTKVNSSSLDHGLQYTIDNLKLEIEAFCKEMVDGMLTDTKTVDICFCAKIIGFDQQLFGKILKRSIHWFYEDVGFQTFLQIIDEFKNIHTSVDGYEAIFKELILDGPEHRKESCELTNRLKILATMEESDQLTDDQEYRIANMIERLAPYSIPLVKKIFAYDGLGIEMTKEEKEIGVSYPVFSKTGNWAEHNLLMGIAIDTFKEQEKKYKNLLRK